MIDLDVASVPVEQLPALLGELGRCQGEALARLNTPSAPVAPERLLTVEEAAAIAGMSPRWLRSKTRGRRFRVDLSRKSIRFEEAGLRAWLTSRRAR